MAAGLVLVLLLLVAGVAVNVRRSLGPVSRERVEKFARRQELAITSDNGNQVIAYLATTRRWRVTGLLVSILVSVAWGWADGHATLAFVPLLSGWFAGAVVAEWRIGHRRAHGPRAASLVPRTPSSYIGPTTRRLPVAAAVVGVAVAVATATIPATRHATAVGATAFLAAIALVLAALLRLVEERILDRAQPLDAPDVVAADDAIRSRSLHVVAGATVAFGLFCVAQQCAVLADTVGGHATGRLRAASYVVWLLGILCGRATALTPWRVRRPVPVAPAISS